MRLTLFFIFVFLAGCMTSTVQLEPKFDRHSPPSFEDYYDGYLLGLASPDVRLTLSDVCMDQKIYGYQKLHSPEDGFFSFITLGIYTPLTVRVWCGP